MDLLVTKYPRDFLHKPFNLKSVSGWEELNLLLLGPKPSVLPMNYTPLKNNYIRKTVIFYLFWRFEKNNSRRGYFINCTISRHIHIYKSNWAFFMLSKTFFQVRSWTKGTKAETKIIDTKTKSKISLTCKRSHPRQIRTTVARKWFLNKYAFTSNTTLVYQTKKRNA